MTLCQSINSNSTAVIVAARALEDFAKAFPDEVSIWIEQEPETLQFTIQSILKNGEGSVVYRNDMFKRTWDHVTQTFTS